MVVEPDEVDYQLAHYAPDADIQIVDPDNPPAAPHTLSGKPAIHAWMVDSITHNLDLYVTHLVDRSEAQRGFGGLDIAVRRNAFGRQVESFETDLDLTGIDGGPVHAVFIRAPWVEGAGKDVRVLATVTPPGTTSPRAVAVQQRRVLATAFHPEVTTDLRVHRQFLRLIRHA